MKWKFIALVVLALFVVQSPPNSSANFASFQAANNSVSTCPQGTALPDGCSGAAATGVKSAIPLVIQTVVDVQVSLGTSPTDGTYALTASGCSGSGFLGSVTVLNGFIVNYPTVTTPGSGYTCKPTVSIPGGLGTGAAAVATVYKVRPSWNVPYWDYPIGLPTTVVPSDPLPSGSLAPFFGASGLKCTLGGAQITISCTDPACANATISGWDFGGFGHGGIRLETTCSGVHITQNNFKVGTNTVPNLHIQAGTVGCLIDYNTFDGSGIPTSDGGTGDIGGLLVINNTGTCTLQYNYITSVYFQNLEKGGDTAGTTTQVTKYNFIQDAGTGHLPSASFTGAITGVSGGVGTLTISGISGSVNTNIQVCTPNCVSGVYSGYITGFGTGTGGNGTYTIGHATATASTAMTSGDSHGDQTQDIVGTGDVIANLAYQYNSWRQRGTNSTQGLSICSAGGQTGGQCQGATVDHNWMVFGAYNTVTYNIIIDNTWQNGASAVNSNFVDPTGISVGGGSWFFFGQLNGTPPTGDGPFNGTLSSCVGNINPIDGTTFLTTGGNVGATCS